MKYRRLGKTDLNVSVVGIGTWQYGGEWGKEFTQKEVDGILDLAQEFGVNLIDTAECYGDHLSERFIGDYLSRRKREDWIIATKFGHHFHENFERSRHWRPDEVLNQLDASLKALQTDYIDLYQAHSCTDEEFNNDALWTLLDKQVRAGKIRNLGVSLRTNDYSWQTEKASDYKVGAIQVVYNRIDTAPEKSIFPAAQEQNLGVLARVPLASGFLSGKYKPGAFFGDNDVRSKTNEDQINRVLTKVEAIAASEVPEGVPMSSWALSWCLKHPAVTSVIPGCKNTKQVEMNAMAAEFASQDHPQSI
ncbi:aldo/keto reductase [Mesobacillus foraminis]|uniref:Aryl-alcohol dehydrogenase-like predicted oxidoreductase n=1 Tax=Mesobacillus foraminis TaxID=279826 RepID=A0A4R2BJ92_9BACI|nr:aldo/keto reductase [Mesobacillus foraminis]TCN27257.1 aryl-alcohol dehydrogenase-like predicted oxidoreductase [Mesobacillus foraminis]